MDLIYNSDTFSVVQIGATQDSAPPVAGFEILDKSQGRGVFLHGAMALHFHEAARALGERQADAEAIEAFLAGYSGLALQPLVLH